MPPRQQLDCSPKLSARTTDILTSICNRFRRQDPVKSSQNNVDYSAVHISLGVGGGLHVKELNRILAHVNPEHKESCTSTWRTRLTASQQALIVAKLGQDAERSFALRRRFMSVC